MATVENLYSCDYGNTVYKHSGFSSDIVASFTLSNVRGCTWDGTNIITSQSNGNVNRHVGFSSSVNQTLSLSSPERLEWDGTNLIVLDASNRLIKFDGFSTTPIWTLQFPTNTVGVAFDGTNLYTTRRPAPNRVYKHLGYNTTVDTQFDPATAVSGDQARGLAWDGTNLYRVEHTTKKIYKHSGFSDSVLAQFNCSDYSGNYPYDIALGTHIDKFDITLQYKNAGSTFVSVTSSLGDAGSSIAIGSRTCYWNDPGQDRADVEISDAQVQIEATPDGGNTETHAVNVTNATQLTTGDGTGNQGDVKVEYEIT